MDTALSDMIIRSVAGAMPLVAMIGFVFAAVMPGIDRWSKRFFMCFFAILMLTMIVYFIDSIVYNNPSLLQVERVVGFLESLFVTIPGPMLTVYLLHCCSEDFHDSMLFHAVLVFWAVYIALLVAAQFTPVFYYYTEDAELHINPAYSLLIAPVIVILTLNLIGVVRRRKKLPGRLFLALLIFLVPMAIAVAVHLFVAVFPLIYLGVVISGLSMFTIVMMEQIELHMRLQRETARQRTKIMMLQMRPHFIHNTMTSIYYLCDQDPQAAKRVTMDFNTYLRKNFNAIVSEDTIPFSEELEHTRAYLAVEQVQFANKLVVDYDTPHTQFHVPPLTVQPLAENAVKHGMSPNNLPLRITIRTRATESGSEIVVEDNGRGFKPVDGKQYTTLSNIRQRLELMCGGTLDIEPREGGGTVAKVTIP